MSDTSLSTASYVSHGSGAQHDAPTHPTLTARFSCDRFVPHLVSQQAIRNPGHLALVDDAMRLTHGELDTRAGRLADHLHALGVGANIVVAVCLPRSPLTAVAALAVLRAGGAYLAMDPNYPCERLSFILADASVPIVLSGSTVANRLPQGSLRLIKDLDVGDSFVAAIAVTSRN